VDLRKLSMYARKRDETDAEHLARLAKVGPGGSAEVAAHVAALLGRVDALERRVAELEAGS
jgi:polyhydroxyalkanoate synthesis regulator phasin